jgi:hypothetical protein
MRGKLPPRKRPIDDVAVSPRSLPTVSKRPSIRMPANVPTKDNADYFRWEAPKERKGLKRSITFSDCLVEETVYNIGTPANLNVPPFVDPKPLPTIHEYHTRLIPTKNVAEQRPRSAYWRSMYNYWIKRGIVQRIIRLNKEGDKCERFIHLASGLILRGSQVKGVITGNLRLNWNPPVPLHPPRADAPKRPAPYTPVAHQPAPRAVACCDCACPMLV